MVYQRAVLIWCVVYKTHSIHYKKQWSKSRRFCKGSRPDSICSSVLHLSSARHAQSVRNTWFINLQKNASQKQIFQQKSYLVLTLLCALIFWLMLCREGERGEKYKLQFLLWVYITKRKLFGAENRTHDLLSREPRQKWVGPQSVSSLRSSVVKCKLLKSAEYETPLCKTLKTA